MHTDVESSDGNWSPISETKAHKGKISIEKKTAAVKYWRRTKVKTQLSLKAVQYKFPFVKSISILYLWEKQMNNKDNRFHKLREINDYTIKKFQKCRENNINVHDCDLKRWALSYARTINFSFVASKSWLLRLKRKNKIRSRKITNFVCNSGKGKTRNIEDSAKAYVNDVKTFISYFGFNDQQVFNCDQSGFCKEIHSGRTLNEIGEKKIMINRNYFNRNPL